MEDQLGGWGPKGWDMLVSRLDAVESNCTKRIDALRSDVNVLMGRAEPHEPEEPQGVTILGWGLANWTALFTAVGVVLAAAASILGKGPGP